MPLVGTPPHMFKPLGNVKDWGKWKERESFYALVAQRYLAHPRSDSMMDESIKQHPFTWSLSCYLLVIGLCIMKRFESISNSLVCFLSLDVNITAGGPKTLREYEMHSTWSWIQFVFSMLCHNKDASMMTFPVATAWIPIIPTSLPRPKTIRCQSVCEPCVQEESFQQGGQGELPGWWEMYGQYSCL